MTENMTAVSAQTFENGPSVAHTALLMEVAETKGCQCQPYIDWFTYRRWQAQGFQVQKGEKGTKLTTWIHYQTTDKEGHEVERTRPKGTSVFCRCQVQPKGQ